MHTTAVVLREPENLALAELELAEPAEGDVIVDVEWSGISTGTERLLWSGQMPQFPGMGYPLVPGYESVGRVADAGCGSSVGLGQRVFVPGASCFRGVRGLFGATASRLVVPARRIVAIDDRLAEQGTLLALAATAYHALNLPGVAKPDRIVGHGVLGRLLARIAVAMGGKPPVVWERNPDRMHGCLGYQVVDPSEGAAATYDAIYDASGDPSLLDPLIQRINPGGEIVLAGFYSERLSFAFPPAFMREARIRVAAEWRPNDLAAVKGLVESGALSLDNLITHRAGARQAASAYQTAFADPTCLKMVLDWSRKT
jgi:3-hydroxyethyl bacteriochlorophyllide a dehydrogenase